MRKDSKATSKIVIAIIVVSNKVASNEYKTK